MLRTGDREARTDAHQLIEQQLSTRIKLRARLKSIVGHDKLSPQDALGKAIEQASLVRARGRIKDIRALNEQVWAVRSKLRELEKKREEIVEFDKQCEKLTKAVETAREYIRQIPGLYVPGKRRRTLADLDYLSAEASATIEKCKKVKTEHISVEIQETKRPLKPNSLH